MPGLISSELGYVPFPLRTQFKALNEPRQLMAKNPFPPSRQLDSICCQQAWCLVNLLMVKETKIPPMAPVSEPPVSQVSFPASFSALLCQWQDWGKHHLCHWSFSQLPQCPEVPSDGLWTSLCDLITANLHYQEGVIIRGPYQTRELPAGRKGPRSCSFSLCRSSWYELLLRQ